MKESIKYSDLCKAFYNKDKTKSVLKYHKSQEKVAAYLTTIALSEDSLEIMPTSSSSFNKWFSGENNQDQPVLEAIRNDLPKRINIFANKLAEEIEPNNVEACATQLGLRDIQGNFDISKFSLAIGKQLLLLAENNGEFENRISEYYTLSFVSTDFKDYITKSKARYNVMKFIGGDEVSLSNYYVCNTLGDKAVTKNERDSYKGVYLDNATVESIRNLYSSRGFDNKKTILIGSGGCGKSLMLQHLFLNSLNNYPITSVLPIFLELRNFKQSDTIESFTYETIRVKDDTITEDILHQLLSDGKCTIMMDGFDEIDPSDINDFQTKLNNFTDQYNNIQIILASRQCDSIRGLNQYVKLYVWPFDATQSELLVSTIIKNTNSSVPVQRVTNFIKNGFLKADGIFSSHPMLLSFITINGDKIPSFEKDHLLFYRATYDALLTGHDDNKKPYDRVFHSVDNASEFSIVFREFCALTYRKGVFSFDNSSFDQYFNELTSYKKFENTHKMTSAAFKHDACSTACIMFEEELELWYIDPGFQEFLFAEYYSQANESEITELERSLSVLPFSTLHRFDALEMLERCSAEKFKFYVLLPYLDTIFKGDEEQSFMRFLQNTFNEFYVVNVSKHAADYYLSLDDYDKILYPLDENHPKSILISYILKQLDLDFEFRFNLLSVNDIDPHSFITEETTINGIIVGQANYIDEKKVLLLSTKPIDVYEYLNTEYKTSKKSDYFIAEDDQLAQLGVRVAFDSYYLELNPDKYSTLVTNIMTHSSDTYNVFKQLSSYHKKLKIDKRRKGW